MIKVEKGLIARKVGMTSIFNDDGKMVTVTVLEAGPCKVLQRKTLSVDGYESVQLGFLPKKIEKETKSIQGHLKKNSAESGYSVIKELRVDAANEKYAGSEVNVEIFAEKDTVSVSGLTKGRGFSGGVKRHGFTIGPISHGSKHHRRSGSIGAGTFPGKVWKGKKMPGHYGHEQQTTRGLKVVKVDIENNLLLVKGAVPGPVNGIVTVLG